MKNFLRIALLTVGVSAFYTVVGRLLPQLESRPPKELKVGEALSTEELVAAGSGVFDANCVQCHKIGRTDRCPDLAGIGTRAKERAAARSAAAGKTFDDLDYLLESLCKPGDYLVPGYESLNIMPAQGKLLSGGQMIAVAAFLQDLGGAVTASVGDVKSADERLARFDCGSSHGGGAGGAPVAAKEPVGPPDQVFTSFGCNGCHALDKPDRTIGPSLQDVGKRLSPGELYESILAPDAKLSPGEPPFPPGLMSGTLGSNGFYDRMTPADYKALVDWLAARKG